MNFCSGALTESKPADNYDGISTSHGEEEEGETEK